jgi:Rieske Fe-S protein
MPMVEAVPMDGRVTVPLSAFDHTDFLLIRVRDYLYDIAVRKFAGGSFRAWVLRCTHADNQLTFTRHGYTCAAHGSIFDLEGKVTGGPAQRPLQQLKTDLTRDSLVLIL